MALILKPLHENYKHMSLTDTARADLANTLGAVKVAAGLVLLAAISWEIIAGDHVHMSGTYLIIQFIVCLVLRFFRSLGCRRTPSPFFLA